MLQILGQGMYLMTNTPVHRLNLGARLQVDNTMSKQVEHLFTYLLGIVPVFQYVAGRQVVPNLVEVLYQLM